MPHLERKARKYFKGEDGLAEEMVAETYVKAWEAFSDHDRSKKVQNWIEKKIEEDKRKRTANP